MTLTVSPLPTHLMMIREGRPLRRSSTPAHRPPGKPVAGLGCNSVQCPTVGLPPLQIAGIYLRQISWRQTRCSTRRGRAPDRTAPSMSCFTSSFQGHVLPLRSPQHRPSRGASHQQLQVHAVATGPRPQDRPLDVNGNKTDSEDAFKKLIALSNKQSVNRPQNVGGVTAASAFGEKQMHRLSSNDHISICLMS